MRKGKRESGSASVRILTSVLAGGAAAFGMSLLVLAGAAAAISSGALAEGAALAATMCAVAAGSFAGGLLAALRAKSHVFPVAAASGGLCVLLWIVAGLVTGGTLEGMALLRTLCSALVGGCLAGFLCPKPKKRRK